MPAKRREEVSTDALESALEYKVLARSSSSASRREVLSVGFKALVGSAYIGVSGARKTEAALPSTLTSRCSVLVAHL